MQMTTWKVVMTKEDHIVLEVIGETSPSGVSPNEQQSLAWHKRARNEFLLNYFAL